MEIASGGANYEDAMLSRDLCRFVLEWANGAPFAEVIEPTELSKGDIVVYISRLSELLKDAQSVA